MSEYVGVGLVDPYDDHCPRCGQSREDGLAYNRAACGHEWHGSEELAGPGEDPQEPPDEDPAEPRVDILAEAIRDADPAGYMSTREQREKAVDTLARLDAARPDQGQAAPALDPSYLAQEGTGAEPYVGRQAADLYGAALRGPGRLTEDEERARQQYRPMIATDEYPNGRPIDPEELDDRRAWGATVDFMLSVGQLSEQPLTDLDRRCLADYYAIAEPEVPEQGETHRAPETGHDAWALTQEQLAAELDRAPMSAVDPDDDRWAEVIYHVTLAEPFGDAVPAWAQLSDATRATYRTQARRARELLGPVPGAVEPQRVVVGFGSPQVVADVLAELRRWKTIDATEGPTTPEIEALIARIEGGE